VRLKFTVVSASYRPNVLAAPRKSNRCSARHHSANRKMMRVPYREKPAERCSVDKGDYIMLAQRSEKILQHYNNLAIAVGYGQQEYLTPCERLLFDTYIKPGMAILDIGVGGGRTSPYLAVNASRYAGIDYASEMLEICRKKYPKWEYTKCSATDLSPFQRGSFDVVVISFNMLDDLFPHENRWRCLQECHRVLRENGLLIFSSHNPRILARPRKAGETKKNGQSNSIFTLFRKVLNLSAKFLIAVRSSARDALSRGTKPPFWRCEGYLLDEKLITHFWMAAGWLPAWTSAKRRYRNGQVRCGSFL
jgi:ubiquinone/menaquinone biosynthesis C-methylase UbiE